MTWPLAAFSAVFVVFLALLLWVSQRQKQRYALAKGVQSTLFVLAALLAFFTGSAARPAAFALLLAALILCAFGDIALGVANQARRKSEGEGKEKVGTAGIRKAPFLAGAAAFLLAHLVFCVLYFHIAPFHPLVLVLPVACVILIYSFEHFGLIRTGKMKPLVFIYPFVVGMMASSALATAIAAGPSPYGALTVAGSILFLISDAILVFLYFGVKKHVAFRISNLLTYYLGVFLLALSSHWF